MQDPALQDGTFHRLLSQGANKSRTLPNLPRCLLGRVCLFQDVDSLCTSYQCHNLITEQHVYFNDYMLVNRVLLFVKAANYLAPHQPQDIKYMYMLMFCWRSVGNSYLEIRGYQHKELDTLWKNAALKNSPIASSSLWCFSYKSLENLFVIDKIDLIISNTCLQ